MVSYNEFNNSQHEMICETCAPGIINGDVTHLDPENEHDGEVLDSIMSHHDVTFVGTILGEDVSSMQCDCCNLVRSYQSFWTEVSAV